MNKQDFGLDTLLSMHGYQHHMDNGYWWKIEAYRVSPSITWITGTGGKLRLTG